MRCLDSQGSSAEARESVSADGSLSPSGIASCIYDDESTSTGTISMENEEGELHTYLVMN